MQIYKYTLYDKAKLPYIGYLTIVKIIQQPIRSPQLILFSFSFQIIVEK